MYLAELTLVDADPFLKFLPSIIAASSVYLARCTLGMEPWPRSLVESTGYRDADLEECVRHLHKSFSDAPHHPQQAIREKYKQDK